MLKKLIDTNIFIDRFSNPDLFKDIFLSEGIELWGKSRLSD